jgi:hypothetical protein
VSAARGQERGLPGVSFDWGHVDAFALVPRLGGKRDPADYFGAWTREALAHEVATPREPWLVVVHPFCSGLDPWFEPFAGFVQALASKLEPRAFRTLESLLGPSC